MTCDSIHEQFERVAQLVREQEMIVAAHPDDVTPELRVLIEATPHATLRESRYVEPGKLFVIHPGLLGDPNG